MLTINYVLDIVYIVESKTYLLKAFGYLIIDNLIEYRFALVAQQVEHSLLRDRSRVRIAASANFCIFIFGFLAVLSFLVIS